jgi:hypothetical protein
VSDKSSKNVRPVSKLEAERESAYKSFSDSLFSSAESIEIAEKREEEIDLYFENERLSLDNRLEKQEVRKQWNRILMWLVVFGFIFSYLMIILIGFKIMNFENSEFAVPSVVAAGVVQTYGLAKLAIKYFFSEDEKNKTSKKR